MDVLQLPPPPLFSLCLRSFCSICPFNYSCIVIRLAASIANNRWWRQNGSEWMKHIESIWQSNFVEKCHQNAISKLNRLHGIRESVHSIWQTIRIGRRWHQLIFLCCCCCLNFGTTNAITRLFALLLVLVISNSSLFVAFIAAAAFFPLYSIAYINSCVDCTSALLKCFIGIIAMPKCTIFNDKVVKCRRV